MRSLRKIDGERVETKPRGLKTIITTIAEPEQQAAILRRDRNRHAEIVAINCLQPVEFAQHSKPPIRTTAASATPICEPMPPSTTIARIVADSLKVKLSGLTKPWRTAKNEPARPPKKAPSANAVSLVLRGVDAERPAGDLVLAQRLPGAADRQPAQPQRHEIGEEREAEDDVIEEDLAVDRRVVDAEEIGEAVVGVGERQAEEGDLRDRGDARRSRRRSRSS